MVTNREGPVKPKRTVNGCDFYPINYNLLGKELSFCYKL